MTVISEEWKPCSASSKYEVSNLGRVRSRFKILKPQVHYKTGYPQIMLRIDGRSRLFAVHRLVLSAFKPTPNEDALQVDHINGRRDDNRLENLEWVSCSENLKRTYKRGRPSPINRTKMTRQDVKEIRAWCAVGMTHQSIADTYGIAVSHVHRIRYWKHHTDDLGMDDSEK